MTNFMPEAEFRPATAAGKKTSRMLPAPPPTARLHTPDSIASIRIT